jgi:hypothetical protein
VTPAPFGGLAGAWFYARDPGVVNDRVQHREVGGNLCGECFHPGRVLNIEGERLHARIGGRHLVQNFCPTAGE